MTAVRTARPAGPVLDLTEDVPLVDRRDGNEGDDGDVVEVPGPEDATEAGRSGSRLRRFWFLPAGVALLGAAALVPSVGGRGPGPGEARLDVRGTAVVTSVDGEVRTVRDARTDVGPGDEVEVVAGTTRFEMSDGVRLEGRAGPAAGGREGTTVAMAVAPRLVAGPLLAVTPRELELRAGDALVQVAPISGADGVVRLDQRIGLGVGTYAGVVEVTSAGRTADVPSLRRVDVAAPGAVGDAPQPLRYDAADTWDRRYLGDALALDAQLAPLLAGAGTRTDAFLDAEVLADALDLAPGTRIDDRVADLDDGGDALVVAAIAAAADGRSLAPAWDRAIGFHTDGAPWGLTALDQGAGADRVLAAVRSALDTFDLSSADDAVTDSSGADVAADATDGATSPTTTAPAGGAATDPAATTPGATDPATPSPDPGGGTGGGGGGGGGTPVVPVDPGVPAVPGLPPVTTPPLPTPGQVGGTVGGIVDDVTDGVDTVVPGAGGAVGGVVDGVGGVVGGVGGTVGGVGGAAGGTVGGTVGAVGGIIGGLGTGLAAG